MVSEKSDLFSLWLKCVFSSGLFQYSWSLIFFFFFFEHDIFRVHFWCFLCLVVFKLRPFTVCCLWLILGKSEWLLLISSVPFYLFLNIVPLCVFPRCSLPYRYCVLWCLLFFFFALASGEVDFSVQALLRTEYLGEI